jgi:diaminopimelate epimerase
MQGLGNDFVVLDGVRQSVPMTAALARRLADRHFGVGCDQVLLVEPPQSAQADFRYRIWNADGGEVGQCGNGARCFVRFVRDRGLSDKNPLRVETRSGLIVPRLETDGQVSVDMGPPRFEPRSVPFASDSQATVQPLDLGAGRVVQITALSMGNPHAVQVVDDVEAAPVTTEGPLIENHPRFPERVNAGYVQVLRRDRIKLRVWERGAGETLACGTGACAAVAAGVRRGLLDGGVRVATRGGDLTIEWRGGDNPVWMTGPAVTVFEGEINVES